MEFKVESVKGIPIVYCDDFYSKEEVDVLCHDVERIRVLGVLDSSGEHGAKNIIENKKTGEKEEVELAKNQTAWVNNLYSGEPRLSDILNITSKVHDPKIIEYLAGIHHQFISMKMCAGTGTLLSYYDESEHYENHRDSCFVTALTWLYKEPRAFEGGEFVIEDELKIDCVRGRTLFMPGYSLHKVVPVSMPKDKQGKGLGRYTLTKFIKDW